MRNSISYWLLLPFLGFLSFACGGKGHHSENENSDTLKVVTLYGPSSYFHYRGEEMGVDYENVRRFAEDNNLVLDIKVVNNIPELISSLKNKEAQLAAYPVPFIAEYNSEILHCGPKDLSHQVLVQKNNKDKLTDVTQLVGKEVFVEDNSKFYYRLLNLNEELGGGIKILTLSSDTITSEDIMDMVDRGEIPFGVIDSDIAALYKNSFPYLDTSLALSLDQAASWAVAPGLDSLASQVDNWNRLMHDSPFIKEIYKRYYDRQKYDIPDADLKDFKNQYATSGGKASNYDALFKKFSQESGFDWELLAAIAYCESRFQPSAQSRFGATGLMQVMPSSATAVGIDPSNLTNPETNIRAATKILSRMNSSLEKRIEDPQERMKFLIASYNSGLGHIFDSIELARKTGLDSGKWIGNVSVAVLMKSKPEYYNDPVVRHGYFRGRETVEFVDNVMTVYNFLRSH